ncbi:hypothetical protein RugamoR64_16290 [Duganella rhizosphaerae]|uniref:DUF2806 domain-containing protein n=1 Tax=Duganella rhizosphaerae TaxID=2885763 RepID=UPI0030E806EE
MSVEINLIPGEKLVMKMWESLVDKGIANALAPWQARRMAAATTEIERRGLLALAQAEKDASDIRAGRKLLLEGGKLERVEPPALELLPMGQTEQLSPTFIDAALTSSIKDAIRREVSTAKAVAFAEAELTGDSQEPPETTVSDDWLLRWRDNAASISSDELQALWGKVLAGEVKSPGTFSMRTLEFLRNISREDAALIEKAAPYVIAGVIFRAEHASGLGELSFSEIMELQEIGILSGVEAIGMQTNYGSVMPDRFVQSFTSYGRLILATHADSTRRITLPIYSVTRTGREVLGLGWKRTDEANLRAVAERIKAMGFETQIGDYVEAGKNFIQFANMVTI